MKSLVFYHTKSPKAGTGYSIVRVGCCARTYIRAEQHETDFETALENARPREGETVLNAVPLD